MIVLDIETSGLDPRYHSILSVGALDLTNPENYFYSECRVWDGAQVEDEALAVNGFNRAEVTDPTKEGPDVLIHSFLKWTNTVKQPIVAGHNVWFDYSFLRDTAERFRENWPLPKRMTDTHSLTLIHLLQHGQEIPINTSGKWNINSDFVFKYVGIESERGVHDALEDAKLTAEAISRLVYDKPLLPEYSHYKIPWLVK